MLYGEEKALEMSKSLHDPRHKAKRNIKKSSRRSGRRYIKERLRSIKDEEDYYENNLEFELFNGRRPKEYNRHGYHCHYYNNYYIFKHSHLIKWAKKKAAHIPGKGKYDFIRSALPKSESSNIVMRYISWDDDFKKRCFPNRRYYYKYDKRKVIYSDQIKEYLREILLDSRAHRMLNNFIKDTHSTVYWEQKTKIWDRFHDDGFYFETKFIRKDKGPRILRGINDVNHFFNDLTEASRPVPHVKKLSEDYVGMKKYYDNQFWSKRLPNPHYHPEWKSAAIRFIEIWLDDKDNYAKHNSYYDRYGKQSKDFKYIWRW